MEDSLSYLDNLLVHRHDTHDQLIWLIFSFLDQFQISDKAPF